MRVLLTSHGSTGDIFPIIGLGRALVEAGHQVRFASATFFRDEIERAGIDYVYLPPDWDQRKFAEAMRHLTKAKNPVDLVRIIYSESLPFLDEILTTLDREMAQADVFVSNYLFASLSSLARLRGVPCAVTTFAHNVVPSFGDPPKGVPQMRCLPPFLRRKWNRFTWHLADRLLCWQINRVVGEKADNYGMGRARSFFLDPADKVIVTVSPGLFEPESLWDKRFIFAGYLRWQTSESPAIEMELECFCEGEKVPVLTFGSVTFDKVQEIMERFMKNWPVGKKIIIQSGWAELTMQPSRPEMKYVGKVSHDQLFKHGSMVIHHGGAGTTASVLHAGIPSIIIPHIGDQSFFASEVKRLGVGLEVKRRKWPEVLPEVVQMIEKDSEMASRAREIARLLDSEDGPGRAVRELELLELQGTKKHRD